MPLGLVPLSARVLADVAAPRLGAALADRLQRAFAWRETYELETTRSDSSLDLDLDTPWVPGLDVFRSPTPAPEDLGRRASNRGLSAPRGGILVRAGVVAEAVRSGARPSGAAVPASGPRPAGLVLQGVSGFGAGLRDGDVLTRVGGAPATSTGMVVGVIAGALRQNAKIITGEVWRGDQRLVVAVEIPQTRRQNAPPPD